MESNFKCIRYSDDTDPVVAGPVDIGGDAPDAIYRLCYLGDTIRVDAGVEVITVIKI